VNISDEAVHVALSAYYASIDADNGGPLVDMRAALEAAAPHLMAVAWDEGHEEGYEAGRDRGTPEQPNPYRDPR
jgi:hypothetical protein